MSMPVLPLYARPFPVPRLAAIFLAAIFLAAILLAATLAQGPALAQGEGAAIMNWRLTAPSQPGVAPARPAQTYRARRRYDTPVSRFPDDAALGLVMPDLAIAVPLPADPNRPRIQVIGDSLAEALASGMEADPAMRADFTIKSRTISASGLVRDDFHDWAKTLPSLLAEAPAPHVLVVMLGLNDRQVIRLPEGTLEPLSEPWREAYRRRVDAIIREAQAAKVPLVWVGMPIMRLPRLSTDLASLNEMIRDRVTSAGETFVETFDGFADQWGGFTATGPDVIGDVVRLRGADGIHFTPAGQRKLAFFVEKPLRRRIGDPPAAEAQAAIAALPAPGPADPRGTVAAPAALPAPRLPSLPALPRARPEIGETRPLSGPVSATSLVGQRGAPIEDPATRDLFDRGHAPAPKPGRSDDFRWK